MHALGQVFVFVLPFAIAANAVAIGVWAARALERRGWRAARRTPVAIIVGITALALFWAYDIYWLFNRRRAQANPA